MINIRNTLYIISFSTNPHRQTTTTQAGWGMMIPLLFFVYITEVVGILQGVLTGYAGRKQAAVASNIHSLCVLLERVWVQPKKNIFAPKNLCVKKCIFILFRFG